MKHFRGIREIFPLNFPQKFRLIFAKFPPKLRNIGTLSLYVFSTHREQIQQIFHAFRQVKYSQIFSNMKQQILATELSVCLQIEKF